jgi:hypothetical protein
MEIYIDLKVVPQMITLNQMYQLAEEKIKEQGIAKDSDKILSLLNRSSLMKTNIYTSEFRSSSTN